MRVLLALVALLLAAGAHAEAVEGESAAVPTAQACDAEYDASATALRRALRDTAPSYCCGRGLTKRFSNRSLQLQPDGWHRTGQARPGRTDAS
ncbi:hypothetical protein OG936_34915 [Streptomyces sp. NBC_00846]|uniref:hypothetical protein n=1 Tax=Streptomyces sp. NBC_00846 TaxID=2975849 RepID=UPI00386F1C2A|nr:hypothetical protein OG936_34915 [Streptomyces sp. NBC_00846]